jgi:hypothetical protein
VFLFIILTIPYIPTPAPINTKIVININNYKSNIKTLSKIGITPEDTQKIKTLLIKIEYY